MARTLGLNFGHEGLEITVIENGESTIEILGVALLPAAPLWVFLVAPELLKLPSNFSFTADVVSVDDFYDEEHGIYSGGIFLIL